MRDEYVVFNAPGVEPADLVVEHAEKFASKIGGGTDATKGQVRRFYQEYVAIRNRINTAGEDAYEKNEVALKMLISKAVYAGARKDNKKDNKIPEELVEWLKDNISQIKSKDDVNLFGDYFESFVGYFYGKQANQTQNSHGNRRGQRR